MKLNWLPGEVEAIIPETARARTIVLRVPGWSGHIPGQHVDIRLTSEDGYQAQRSYSIATPTDGERIAITVELIDDGEVSPYLVEELLVSDQFELRGPIGGYFVWDPSQGGPLQLIGGGAGLVPLMAMTRSLDADRPVPTRLLLSAKTRDDILYRQELESLPDMIPELEIAYTLTRAQPPGWTGYARRVDREMLSEVVWPAADHPATFVCGPTGFVETVASTLIDLGHQIERVKTERFGPSGG